MRVVRVKDIHSIIHVSIIYVVCRVCDILRCDSIRRWRGSIRRCGSISCCGSILRFTLRTIRIKLYTPESKYSALGYICCDFVYMRV